MADATPRSYIFGIIAFVFIILAGLTLFTNFAVYNTAMTNNDDYAAFTTSFNKTAELETELEDIRTGIEDSSASEFTVFGVLNALVSSAWTSLKLLFTSFGFMDDTYNSLHGIFGLPDWLPGLIILSVITMLAFTIWSAIFQSEL